MSKKRAIHIAMLVLMPLLVWLCLTAFFAGLDDFDRVFSRGTPMERATNLICLVLSGCGVFGATLMTIFAAQSLIESFDNKRGPY